MPTDGRVVVGVLWTDTASNVLKRCTDTNPVTFVGIEGGGGAASVTSSEVSSLEARVSALSTAPAGVSVTSSELSAVSAQALSALNVVSNALSNETSNRTSADNALSAAINVVSNAVSNEISNRASAVNVVSNALSNETSNRVSADAAVSLQAASALSVVVDRLSTVSGLVSTLDARVSANSVTLSALSATVSLLNSAYLSLVDRVSANSAAGGGGGGSVTSTEVSAGDAAVSAQAASAASVLNAALQVVSAAVVTGDAAVSAQAASAIGVITGQLASVSARTTANVSVKGVQSAINALSSRISVLTALASNLNSNILSVSNFANLVSRAVSTTNLRISHPFFMNSEAVSVSAGTVVYAVSAPGGAGNFGFLVASRDNPAAEGIIGLVERNVAPSGQASVQPAGIFRTLVATMLSAGGAISAGRTYYLGLSGKLSVGPPTSGLVRVIGTAMDSGSMALQLAGVDAPGNELAALSDRISTLSATVSTFQSAYLSLVDRVSSNSATGGDGHVISLLNADSVPLSAGMPVYVWRDTDSNFGGTADSVTRCLRASWDGTFTANYYAIGFVVDNSVAVSAVARVQVGGILELTSTQWGDRGASPGLNTGYHYNVASAPGAITAGAPEFALNVGYALSPTKMLVLPQTFPDFHYQVQSAIGSLSTRVSAAQNQVSTLSATVSLLNSAYLSLVDRVSANSATGGGGTGSVTSAELDAVNANLLSVISVLSSRLSAVSVLSGAVSVEGLQSALDTLSNQVSREISNRTSADDAVSGRAASALQTLSTTLKNEIGTLSLLVSAQGTNISTLSAKVVSVSAQLVSLETHASTASAAATSVDARLTSVNNNLLSLISVLSSKLSAVSAFTTAGTSVKGLQSVIIALSARISAAAAGGGGGGGSVTSAEIHTVSALSVGVSTQGLQSIINALSNTISDAKSVGADSYSVLSAAIASVNQRVSVMGSVRIRLLGNITTVSATALTNISGLSASVDAGGIYKVEGHLMHTHSAANAFGLGVTFPAMAAAAGGWSGIVSLPAAGALWVSTVTGRGAFNANGSGSITYSAAAGASAVPLFTKLEGIFNVSAAGIIQVQARVSATGTGAIHFLPGSYLICRRLN
jgi:trimeric autotransporter adhesin